jgi:hypothetical protein
MEKWIEAAVSEASMAAAEAVWTERGYTGGDAGRKRMASAESK